MTRNPLDHKHFSLLSDSGFRRVAMLPLALVVAFGLGGLLLSSPEVSYEKGSSSADMRDSKKTPHKEVITIEPLNIAEYDRRLLLLANNPPVATTTATSTASATNANVLPPPPLLWPAETVRPNAGAILPFKRIIAYYGNLYSTKMGVLGEYAEDDMLARLKKEVDKWTLADPETPAIPALHYIAVTAQGSAGEDGKYRLRMPDSQIDEVLRMAEKINAIVFLDIQVGLSNLQAEIPRLEKYLKLPNVHLGIDAEFSMKGGDRPGTVVGTFDAIDINYAAEFLARVVRENGLTPKVLVVHRYTQKMITNYKNIKPLPEVQVVMHMDGWGGKAKKKNTYRLFVYNEPVQFAGFKIFYKHDIKEPGTTLFTPQELLEISPRPVYIQFQ